MDKQFGRKGMWFALGVLALVFLCLLACGAAAAVFAPRGGGVWVQPPASEAGAVQPPMVYYAHGGWGPLGLLGAGIGLLFKLAFWGLLAMLFLGLLRRLFWGRRHACPPPWYGAWQGAPQGASGGEGEAPAAGPCWGPSPGVGCGPSPWRHHAWRHHRHHRWGPPPGWGPQPPEQAAEGGAGEDEPQAPDSEYTGPME
ncbi:MAG: hypothetical protein P8129_07200 [Anaerolineae bacterium]|jgi:hypothetical protein